jgi:hypothetical protein
VVRKSRILISAILNVYCGYTTLNFDHFFFTFVHAKVRFTQSVIRHYITQFNDTENHKLHHDTVY